MQEENPVPTYSVGRTWMIKVLALVARDQRTKTQADRHHHRALGMARKEGQRYERYRRNYDMTSYLWVRQDPLTLRAAIPLGASPPAPTSASGLLRQSTMVAAKTRSSVHIDTTRRTGGPGLVGGLGWIANNHTPRRVRDWLEAAMQRQQWRG